MFANKSVLPLFPCNVWVHELEPKVFEPMNAKLLARIEELLTPRPKIQPGFTWQTRNDLQDDPVFAEVVALFCNAFDGVLEFLQVETRSYEVTGCWANVNPGGSPHSAHIHPNNYLSGAYFLRTSEGSDSITFHDPRAVGSMIRPKYSQRTQHNSDSINVDAKVGRLVIFPAWMKHSVGPNQSTEERVSMTANMMFSDFTKTMSRPLWSGV
jgi:uncharacterized protein (TIGR02466 family)